MIAAAALLFAAQPAAVFAPPLDRPLRIRTEEEHRGLGTIRRYVAEYRLVFRRENGALLAELTLLALSSDADEPVARRFLATAGGLRDRPVRFRLSPAGAIVSVEDEAAVWAAATAPFARLRAPRTPNAPAPDAALAGLPPERRLAILADPLVALIAAREAAAMPGTARVALPLPGGESLPGTREVRVEDGRTVLVTRAADASRGTAIERTRTVDRSSGLLVSQDETLRRGVGDDEEVTRTRITVTG